MSYPPWLFYVHVSMLPQKEETVFVEMIFSQLALMLNLPFTSVLQNYRKAKTSCYILLPIIIISRYTVLHSLHGLLQKCSFGQLRVKPIPLLPQSKQWGVIVDLGQPQRKCAAKQNWLNGWILNHKDPDQNPRFTTCLLCEVGQVTYIF